MARSPLNKQRRLPVTTVSLPLLPTALLSYHEIIQSPWPCYPHDKQRRLPAATVSLPLLPTAFLYYEIIQSPWPCYPLNKQRRLPVATVSLPLLLLNCTVIIPRYYPANMASFSTRPTAEILFGYLVAWLLKVPATCRCISGTEQAYMLPH